MWATVKLKIQGKKVSSLWLRLHEMGWPLLGKKTVSNKRSLRGENVYIKNFFLLIQNKRKWIFKYFLRVLKFSKTQPRLVAKNATPKPSVRSELEGMSCSSGICMFDMLRKTFPLQVIVRKCQYYFLICPYKNKMIKGKNPASLLRAVATANIYFFIFCDVSWDIWECCSLRITSNMCRSSQCVGVHNVSEFIMCIRLTLAVVRTESFYLALTVSLKLA